MGNRKHIMIKIVLALAFLTGVLIPDQFVKAAFFTPMCSGDDCTGYYADSSCTASSGGDTKTYNYAFIERRQSTVCNAQWTRITNLNANARYTAGSTRYGGAYYSYAQSVQSGGAIANGQLVFTPMLGDDDGVNSINALSCGNTSSYSMSLPIGGTQPASSPACTGVW